MRTHGYTEHCGCDVHTHECRRCGDDIYCTNEGDGCWEGDNVGCINEQAENAAEAA
mgnify:CR=1 FL=1